MFGLFFKIFQALGLCLAVLAFGIFLLKRFAPSAAKSGPRRMRIIERLAISSKTCLLLVEMDGRSVLLSVGSERVSISENELPFKLAAEEEKEFDLICNQEAIKLSA